VHWEKKVAFIHEGLGQDRTTLLSAGAAAFGG